MSRDIEWRRSIRSWIGYLVRFISTRGDWLGRAWSLNISLFYISMMTHHN
jgi:hypothetical protein